MTSNPQSTDNLVTSRNAELDIAARKKLANSRNRNEALEVIVPRILGGIESNGHVDIARPALRLEVRRPGCT